MDLELRLRSLGAAQQLLAFGADLEILAPSELREDLACVASGIAALYAAGPPT